MTSGAVSVDFDHRRAAQDLAQSAFDALGQIIRASTSDTAKLGAAREILDRAYGKCRAGEDVGGGPVTVVIRQFTDGGLRGGR